jgi:AraC family transcriptional regulator, arabinose operon regulatory protein
VLFGLQGPIRVEIDGRSLTARAVLVAPDIQQSLSSTGPTLVVHLDPDSPLWRSVTTPLQHGIAELPWADEQAAQLYGLADCSEASVLRAWLSGAPGFTGAVKQVDGRALALSRRLRAELPERLNLESAARELGLSSARLSRVFREAFAVTPKRFLLHLKMQRALHQWSPGMSATTLAQAAGFYDQPHLIRTAREMFDALPSELLGNPEFRLIRSDY